MPTYGSGTASTATFNYDALFTSTLPKFRAELYDQASTRNLFWAKMREKGMIQPYDGGTHIVEKLITEHNRPTVYKGYDVLDTTPIDGLTEAHYEPSEMATPITISRREERMNSGKAKILDMVKNKQYQAREGFLKWFMTYFLQGHKALVAGSTIATPVQNTVTGATGFDPIAKLIAKDPTASAVIGNINQSTSTWWRNKALSFGGTAVNASTFLQKIDDLYLQCGDNGAGEPDLCFTDRITFMLWKQAYFDKYRTLAPSSSVKYPFETIMHGRATVAWDSRVPDVEGGGLDTNTKGTIYFMNSEHIKIRHDSETDFVMSPFVQPANQQAKIAHLLWMGAITMTMRNTHGVMFNIPRTMA
jgi:hypothetical protein